MGKKLYVGNLPYSVNDQKLNEIFSAVGEVVSAKVITDYDCLLYTSDAADE